MSRSVDEWVGKTPDSKIPDRVRLRVFDRNHGQCRKCRRKIGPSDKWDADHIVALVNGGENRESNLQTLCSWCHKPKTAEDVAEKSKVYKKRCKTLGLKSEPKMKTSRKFDGTIRRWTRELGWHDVTDYRAERDKTHD